MKIRIGSGGRLSTKAQIEGRAFHGAATSAMLAGEEDAALGLGKAPGAVLGLDPGLSCGWCLYHPTRAPAFGIHALAGEDLGEQLNDFACWLVTFIELKQPALLAIERPFGRATFTSDIPGAITSVAHMLAFQHRLPRREFTAPSIKKAMTGSGLATKGAVIKAVRAKFAAPVLSSHEADAAAVAIMAWAAEVQKHEAPAVARQGLETRER